jgi:hypothetical protein
LGVLASTLDLPDEPKRQLFGVPAALIGGAAWIAIGIVLARTFAMGGFERSWLAIGATVAIPATIIAWALAGPHRFRTWIAAVVMVVGVVLTPLASSGATPSPARLATIADDLELPGATVRDVRLGSGRCRPACSELRRTAVVRDISYAKVRAQITGILRASGFEVRIYAHRVGQPLRIDAKKRRLLASFELRQVSASETRIASVFIAKGPAPDHEVG